jgi:ABC-type multidrug transport system fused ATPase/permease subunit
MKFIKNKIITPFEIISLIFKHSPRYFVFFVPQVICSALLPLLYVYAPKLIIEALTEGKDYDGIFKIIVVFCGTALILNLITGYLNKKISYCVENFSRKLSAEIGRTVMNLSLSEIENTTERDNIRLAGNAAGTIELCEIIRKLIQNIITLIGFIGIVSELDIKFIVVVAILLIVKIIFTYINYRANLKLRILTAQNDRTGNYLTNLCYFNQGAAKEIRVNSVLIPGKVRSSKDMRFFSSFALTMQTKIPASQSAPVTGSAYLPVYLMTTRFTVKGKDAVRSSASPFTVCETSKGVFTTSPKAESPQHCFYLSAHQYQRRSWVPPKNRFAIGVHLHTCCLFNLRNLHERTQQGGTTCSNRTPQQEDG